MKRYSMDYMKWLELVKKHRKLFKHDDFYFEVGDGWYELIDSLCTEVSSIKGRIGRFSQIKSKFGSLRASMDEYSEATNVIIRKYEEKSRKTCEYCGMDAEMHTDKGWVITCCSICFVHKINA